MALSNDVHVPCTGKMHRSLPLLQRLALFSLVVLFFLHTCCYGDVGTAARYAPPYLRKYILRKQKEKSITLIPYSLKPYLAIYIAKTLHASISHNNFLINYSHNMLWIRYIWISIQQFVRGIWWWNMGQWCSMWEAVLGEVHQCFSTRCLFSKPDYSDQDCWLY